MKLVEAMYGWNRNSDEIDVGPWPDTTGWSDRYSLRVAPATRISARCLRTSRQRRSSSTFI
jgi:hypothetical protein